MVVGGATKMVANAGGWQEFRDQAHIFNEFYVNYVLLQFFPGMLG